MKVFVQFDQDKLVVPCDGLVTVKDLALGALKRYKAIINTNGVNINRLILMPYDSILYFDDAINAVLEDKDTVLVGFDTDFICPGNLQVSTGGNSLMTNRENIHISQVTSLAENDDNNSGQSIDSGITMESPTDEIGATSEITGGGEQQTISIKFEPLSLSHLDISPTALYKTRPLANLLSAANFISPHQGKRLADLKEKDNGTPANQEEGFQTRQRNRRSLRKILCAESSKLKDTSHSLPNKLSEKNEVQIFECNICQKRFQNYSYMIRHKLIHNKVHIYKCNICKRFFNNASQLKEHKLSHQMKNRTKCSKCLKSFATLTLLRSHRMTAHQSTAECDICKRLCANVGSMKSHRKTHFRTHKAAADNKCDICNKKYRTVRSLKRHRLIHDKPAGQPQGHRCKSCNKEFTNIDELISHRKTSHPVKVSTKKMRSFRCTVCPKFFVRQSDLTRHLRRFLHYADFSAPKVSGKQCDICNKFLSSLGSLKRHRKNTHAGEKSITETSNIVS